MQDKISLKQIEKKAYLAYHRDGLWDIYLGTALLWFGLSIRLDLAYLTGIWVVIFYPGIVSLKKSLTLPRLGYVKFSPERQEKEKAGRAKLSILLAITAILGLVVFWAFTGQADWQKYIRGLGALPFGFVLTAVLAAVGLVFGIYRFIAYGLMVFLFFILGHFMGTELAAVFIFPGSIFTIIGLVMLISFIRQYPKKPDTPFEPYNYPREQG